jgi:hypothetical protein
MATRHRPEQGQEQPEQERPFDGGSGFFGPPLDGFEERGRVIAAFEVPEEGAHDGGSGEPIHLECIDLDWFGSSAAQVDVMLWNDPSSAERLAVLEFDRSPQWLQQVGAPGSVVWYRIDYEPAPAGQSDGLLYRNLFSAGLPVRVIERGRVEEPERLASPSLYSPLFPPLFQEFGLHFLDPDRPEYDAFRFKHADQALQSLTVNRNSSKGVAVYDVGQGTWQGVLHGKTRAPFAYIDTGGGVLYNRKTFPKDFEPPPAVPLVILSHWDWDHWSSATRYRSLLNATWITPSVSAKPIQRRFAMDLIRNGTLRALPKRWTGALQHGCLRLEGCSGRTENDRGLAVTVYSRRNTGRTCLLPGDAAYRYIPSVSGPSPELFDALCMSHHGGRLHSSDYPVPEPKAVAANSAGPGNTYKHPLFRTLSEHKDKGWPMPIQTGFSGSRPCHVFLPWGKRPQLFHGTCDVTACAGLAV